MIKVLYALNGVFHKGGTEAVILIYFDNIDKNKYHIDFLVHGFESENLNNEIHNYLKLKGSKIYYVTPRGKNFLKNKQEIKKIFKNNSYDIVHSHMDAAGSFFLKEAKNANVKVRIAHSHNTDNQINKGSLIKNYLYKVILDKARKSIIKYGNLYLACSKEAGEWMFGKEAFVVINNGIDIKKYSYNFKMREKYRELFNIKDKIVIGHVGRLCYQKNQEFLIDIFNQLYKENQRCFLILVGDGENKKFLESKINKLGLSNEILILDSKTNVSEIIHAFDIFVFPSRFEGLGIVAIEAQAAGLPCLLSNKVPDVVKINDNVRFMDIDSPVDLWCKEILCILKCNYNREIDSNAISKSGYDVKDVINTLEKIYEEAI